MMRCYIIVDNVIAFDGRC